MHRYVTLIFALTALIANARLYYFTSDSIAVPDGEIIAVEARVAQSMARVGEGTVAGWRLSWPGVEISMTFDFRNYVDGVSEDKVTLECNGHKSYITKNINNNGQFNSMAAEWHADGRVKILAGERKLNEYITLDSLPRPEGFVRVTPIGKGDAIIQELIVETNSNSFARLMTDYTAETLDNARQWIYLDRTNDPKTAVVGGRYVLAQIGDELIYLSGAVTNASKWKTGMLKGRLTPTGFKGYYRLQWYDATGRKMPGENFAEHDESLGVLKLTFPELDASIRLKLADKK